MSRLVTIADLDFYAQRLDIAVGAHDHLVAKIALEHLESKPSPMDARRGAAIAAAELYRLLRSRTSLDLHLVFQLTVLQACLALRYSKPMSLTLDEAKTIFHIAVLIEARLPASDWDRVYSVMVRLISDAL